MRETKQVLSPVHGSLDDCRRPRITDNIKIIIGGERMKTEQVDCMDRPSCQGLENRGVGDAPPEITTI